jgi:hypothetical protein
MPPRLMYAILREVLLGVMVQHGWTFNNCRHSVSEQSYPLRIILYLRASGETQRDRPRKKHARKEAPMNPTLVLCIAAIVVEAALAVIKLMNKQK